MLYIRCYVYVTCNVCMCMCVYDCMCVYVCVWFLLEQVLPVLASFPGLSSTWDGVL